MTRFELRFNDREDHAEWDWLVLENGVVVQGFATSTGAERWINDREELTRATGDRRPTRNARWRGWHSRP